MPLAAKLATVAAPVGSLVVGGGLAGLLTVSATRAAFVDTTETPSNSWVTGSVALSDDDGGSALFSSAAMVPGDTITKCIVVTYPAAAGRAPKVDVRLYATSVSTTNAMSGSLTTAVDVG